MGGAAWQDTVVRLNNEGYRAKTLTLTGFETEFDARGLQTVGLERHVADVVKFLEREKLTDVVAHSYSGIVVGQVVDRAPERVPCSGLLGQLPAP